MSEPAVQQRAGNETSSRRIDTMLYQRPKFTCPASSGATTSEKNWDRAFLAPSQFIAKYGESPDGDVQFKNLGPITPMPSVPDCTGTSV